MLALSLALFRCSFVCWLPWFPGLVLCAGWVRSGWTFGARWVPFCASTRASALVGVSGFMALSGMCDMHGQRRGILAVTAVYLCTVVEWGWRLCTFYVYVSMGMSSCSSTLRSVGNVLSFSQICPSFVGPCPVLLCPSSRRFLGRGTALVGDLLRGRGCSDSVRSDFVHVQTCCCGSSGWPNGS